MKPKGERNPIVYLELLQNQEEEHMSSIREGLGHKKSLRQRT